MQGPEIGFAHKFRTRYPDLPKECRALRLLVLSINTKLACSWRALGLFLVTGSDANRAIGEMKER